MEGRRREDAMLVTNISCWRFSKAGWSHLLALFDLRSAFHCPSHEEVAEWTADAYTKEDHNIVVWNAQLALTTTVAGQDGLGDFLVRQGVLMGNKRAPDHFQYALAPRIAHWRGLLAERPQGNAGEVICPISGRCVDIATTKYADDLARRTAGKTVAETIANHKGAIEDLSTALGENYLQHTGKLMILPCLRGDRRASREATANTDGGLGQMQTASRYLGGMLHKDGSMAPERAARIQAMTSAWGTLRSFWTSKTSLKKRSYFFRATVFEAALAGCEAFLHTTKDVDALEAVVAKFGRVLLGGVFDGRRAMSNKEVLNLIGLPPVGVAIKQRRLRILQQYVREPTKHVQVIAALFGKNAWGSGGDD